MEGKRKGSQVFSVDHIYVYTKEKDKERYRYLKCVEFRKGCPGRASIA